MSPALRRRLVPFAFWSIPAVFITALGLHEGEGKRHFHEVLISQGLPWYYWALITPTIQDFARRHPFETLRSLRGVLRHIGAALLAGIGCGLFNATTIYFLVQPPIPEGRTVLDYFLRGVIFWTCFGAFFYTLTATLGFVLSYQERLRERELAASRLEAKLVAAQLGALRMQLQPHFLFNTLNTIAMHVREGDSVTSTRLLARLSEMLRHLLDDGGAQEVPLAVELGHARRYLEIEHARFSDRLTVRFDVPAELEDALVPNLVLQPLIENAVRHGVAERARPGTIGIGARRSGDNLVLSVTNEGAQLPVGFEMAKASGIGLRNTSLRLQHLYHHDGRLALLNHNGGVLAEVTIPYHRTPLSEGGHD